MATDRDFVDYVAEQAGLGERLGVRRMFGEYAVYVDGTVVAFCADNSLFLKRVAQTVALLDGLPQAELFPGSKPYALADELLDDPERLRALLLALQRLLPPPKAKARALR
ncbi:MAG TPA: TfoX/Sxy family protein [Dokdonella sp.]|nr:TfoX/Sxy family protein [Dokdonella sp.]